jgi:hypothetical protein
MGSLALRNGRDPRQKRIAVFGECPQTFGFEVVTHTLATPTDLAMTNYQTNEVRVNALRIAQLGATAHKRFGFPIEETIIDLLSGISVHELIHQLERIDHTRKDKWSVADFSSVMEAMGHPYEKRIRFYYRKPKRKVHEIVCVDLEGISMNSATTNRQQYIHTRRD